MAFERPKKNTANTASVPAPVGGWNARDSLAEMAPTDAVTLTNLYPTPTDVVLRNGWSKVCTGLPGYVNTLMTYAGGATQKRFAASGTNIYDATGTTATAVTTISSDILYYDSLSNIGGNYLSVVNGVDYPLVYNGTDWLTVANTNTPVTISTITNVGLVATMTTASPHGLTTGNQITVAGATAAAYNGTFKITVLSTTTLQYTMLTNPGGAASVVGTYTIQLQITGVDIRKFTQVNLFKHRLFYVEKDSLRVWYLPTDSIGGAALSLDFGGIAQQGGYIQAMGTWTLDAGYGADDYAVFVTNMGEVIVYKGTDPNVANNWSLIGVWEMGYVFTRNCFLKFGGDLLMLSQDGLSPLTAGLQSSRLDPRVNLTDKIFFAISQATGDFSTFYGWQIMYFAKPNMLLINIPNPAGTEQYVMHTISKAWCNFTGIDAKCFAMYGDNLYFGGNGFVGQFFTGTDDNGQPISANVQQAYNYFGSPGQNKRFTLARPTFLVDAGIPSILVGINTDFEQQSNLGSVVFQTPPSPLGKWNIALWDGAIWGGSLTVQKEWQGVTGIGFCGGLQMSMISQGIDVHWASTDYVMEQGGIL